MNVSVIAIDGPAGSGKSTVARALARRLGFRSLDTGLLYRIIARSARAGGVDPRDSITTTELAHETFSALRLKSPIGQDTQIFLDGNQVTEQELHEAEISETVPLVAQHSGVRQEVRRIQRQLIDQGSVIIAGRDIATVVAPDADLKLYLDVSLEERAARRVWAEARHAHVTQVEMEELLKQRDSLDTNRTISPMLAAVDSFVVRSDGMSVPEAVNMILEMCGLMTPTESHPIAGGAK